MCGVIWLTTKAIFLIQKLLQVWYSDCSVWLLRPQIGAVFFFFLISLSKISKKKPIATTTTDYQEHGSSCLSGRCLTATCSSVFNEWGILGTPTFSVLTVLLLLWVLGSENRPTQQHAQIRMVGGSHASHTLCRWSPYTWVIDGWLCNGSASLQFP